MNPNYVPELMPHHIEETNLWKRARLLKTCKEPIWSRWNREYKRGLREQHQQAIGKQDHRPKIGDAVILKDEQKN